MWERCVCERERELLYVVYQLVCYGGFSEVIWGQAVLKHVIYYCATLFLRSDWSDWFSLTINGRKVQRVLLHLHMTERWFQDHIDRLWYERARCYEFSLKNTRQSVCDAEWWTGVSTFWSRCSLTPLKAPPPSCISNASCSHFLSWKRDYFEFINVK